MTDADQKALALAATHPLDLLVERRRGLRGMLGGADGEAMTVRAKAHGLVEAQAWAGRVDQEVVLDLLERPVRCGSGRLDRDVGSRVLRVALRVDLTRPRLDELDLVPLVDRGEREG